MSASKTFRTQLELTIGALRYWAASMQDAADSDIRDDEGCWQIAVKPKTEGACPFRIALRRQQTFDVTLGDVKAGDMKVVDQPITDLAFFVPFVEAIAAGHVVVSEFSSSATGAWVARTCQVRLPDGVWTPAGEPALSEIEARAGLGFIRRDKHFIAYRG